MWCALPHASHPVPPTSYLAPLAVAVQGPVSRSSVHRLRGITLRIPARSLALALVVFLSVGLSNVARGQHRAPVGFHVGDGAGSHSVRIPGSHTVSKIEFDTAGSGGIPHGLIGGTLGALSGGTTGYLMALGLCEKSSGCGQGNAAFAGALIGAILGIGIEWLIRGA